MICGGCWLQQSPDFTPENPLALGMTALNVSVVCMNEEKWENYAPRLGMSPSTGR